MELFQSLCINPLSDLNKYQKVRVLGSGGFGKVYLLQLPNATDFTKGNDTQARFSTNARSGNNDARGDKKNQFAAKMQGFSGGPAINRREASILKRLVNSEVSKFIMS